jgi:hypothetical protein
MQVVLDMMFKLFEACKWLPSMPFPSNYTYIAAISRQSFPAYLLHYAAVEMLKLDRSICEARNLCPSNWRLCLVDTKSKQKTTTELTGFLSAAPATDGRNSFTSILSSVYRVSKTTRRWLLQGSLGAHGPRRVARR